MSLATVVSCDCTDYCSDNTEEVPEEISDSLASWIIGLLLAVASSLFIGASFIIKKLSLVRLLSQGRRAGAGGHGYLTDWRWWAGLTCMAVGEAANFAAYAFVPALLVTPLGALSVVVTAVLASRFLGDNLSLIGKISCLLCLLGSTVTVIHAPKEKMVDSMEELATFLSQAEWIVYSVFIVSLSVVLCCLVAPRVDKNNLLLIYMLVCAMVGSFSVMATKGLGTALKQTAAGDPQWDNWLTYFCLFVLLACISVQMNYLNKALDLFNTSIVTPVYYVFFTAFVMLATGILFKEFETLGFSDLLGLLCGFLITIVSVFMLNLFRDMKITMEMLKREISVVDPLAKEPGFGSGFVGGFYAEDSFEDSETPQENVEGAVTGYNTFTDTDCTLQPWQEPPDTDSDGQEEMEEEDRRRLLIHTDTVQKL